LTLARPFSAKHHLPVIIRAVSGALERDTEKGEAVFGKNPAKTNIESMMPI